jgi:hypothetical protein
MLDFKRLNMELDAVDVVRALGIEVAWVFPRYLRCRCPFHDSRSGRTLQIDREVRKGYCHSRQCHWHGDLIDLWSDVNRVPLGEAARQMQAEFGL